LTKGFLGILIFVVLATPLSAAAQSPAKVFRVGFLSLATGPEPKTDDAIVQGLRDLGYVEGRNLLVERRYAAAKADGPRPRARRGSPVCSGVRRPARARASRRAARTLSVSKIGETLRGDRVSTDRRHRFRQP